MVWAELLYNQQWWRDELWRSTEQPGTKFDTVFSGFRTRYTGRDANDFILPSHTWEKHDGRSLASGPVVATAMV